MEQEIDTFWDDLPSLVGRHPEVVHGAPFVKGENGGLTRLPADTLTGNVEAYIELQGMTKDQAIAATLENFPVRPVVLTRFASFWRIRKRALTRCSRLEVQTNS